MNILVCGAANRFSEQIMRRVAKEGNEIYHLTGIPTNKPADAPVLQQFRVTYLSEEVAGAVASTRADAMVVMGAFDPIFSLDTSDEDVIRYAPSMVNLFSAAKNGGVKRIVYLSSISVYEGNTENLISRKVKPVATSQYGETLARTEELCSAFADDHLEVYVVRLPEVFGDKKDQRTNNICLQYALDYLERDRVEYLSGKSHCAMYYEDAADIVFRIIMGRSCDLEPTMQFLGYRFTEDQLAEVLLASGWNGKATSEAVENYTGEFCLGNIVDTQESLIGAYLKYEFEQSIHLLCESCMKGEATSASPIKRRFIRALPFIESLALCLLAYFAQLAFTGSWVGENFNFFVIYTLILGISYGTGHGLFSACLASFATLVLRMQAASLISILTDFGFFTAVLMLLVVGVVSGFMRDKFKRQTSTLRDENNYIQAELDDVSRINESNLYVKNLYERRLTEYHNSLSRVYELTSALDFVQSRKVIFQAVHVLCNLLEVDDVAIYIASRNPQFYRLAASSNVRSRMCGKTIILEEGNFLYQPLTHDEMFVNSDLNEDHPTYAHAVTDEGNPLAIIMIWAKNIDQINLYQSNMFALMCRLIARSIARAARYEQAISEGSHINGSVVLGQDSFVEYLNLYQDGREQNLLSYELLRLDLSHTTLQDLERITRDTDVLGYAEGQYWLLLSNTEKDEVHFAVERLEKNNIPAVLVDDSVVQSLCKLFEIEAQ